MIQASSTRSNRTLFDRKRAKIVPELLRRLLVYVAMSGLSLVAFHAAAEPFFPLLTSQKARILRQAVLKSKRDTNLINDLIQLGQYYVYKRGEHKADLDTALSFSKQAFSLSKQLGFKRGEIKSMYVTGAIFAEQGDEEKAVSTHTKAIRMCQALGYISLEAEGWYYLGEVNPQPKEFTADRTEPYQKAMELYARAGQVDKQAYTMKKIADINYVAGNLEAALVQSLEALRLYQSIKVVALHHAYSMLVAVSRKMGNYEDAIRYGLAAIESARAAGDTADLSYFYLQVSWTNEHLNQPMDAIRYQKMALVNAQRLRDTISVLNITRYICFNYLLLNRPADAFALFKKSVRDFPPTEQSGKIQVAGILSKYYLYKKDYPLAEKYMQEILEYEDHPSREIPFRIALYQRVGEFYLETGKLDKALEYLRQAMKWTYSRRDRADVYGTSKLHYLLFKLDSAQGDLTSAIAHYQTYKILNDSIFNTTKVKQIASIQIQYDTKKKEQDNALLRRKNQVQQASLREKDLQRNAAFGGVLMLLVLLALSYNQYRIKWKSNALLKAKQEEITQKNSRLQHLLEEKEWLLKEIHHRVKNNLQTVMSLLESQSAYLKNDALAAIRESQHRVQAMALIHQKLYLSENVTSINMQAYIKELVNYLKESFDIRQQIRFDLDLEPVNLDGASAAAPPIRWCACCRR